MAAYHFSAGNLASAFLAGTWSTRAMAARAAQAWGRPERWLGRLAGRVLRAFPADAGRPDPDTLTAFIARDGGFCRARARSYSGQQMPIRRIFCPAGTMGPTPWPVRALPTPGALADWLALTPGELDWFADCQRRLRHAPPGPLRHYTCRWLTGRRQPRLLEMPKARLKALQRRLLHELLEPVAPHDAAHAYRRQRSVASFVARTWADASCFASICASSSHRSALPASMRFSASPVIQRRWLGC